MKMTSLFSNTLISKFIFNFKFLKTFMFSYPGSKHLHGSFLLTDILYMLVTITSSECLFPCRFSQSRYVAAIQLCTIKWAKSENLEMDVSYM
jgi:hypothetical protein